MTAAVTPPRVPVNLTDPEQTGPLPALPVEPLAPLHGRHRLTVDRLADVRRTVTVREKVGRVPRSYGQHRAQRDPVALPGALSIVLAVGVLALVFLLLGEAP